MSDYKQSAFIKLIVAGERKIFGYLVSLLPSVQDAEDIMQDTSVVMWDKFDEFLATQDGEPAVERFVAWGNKIAFYKVLNSRRHRRWSTRLLSNELMQLVADEWSEQEASGQLEERRAVLSKCINELPHDRRQVLHDYYWQGAAVDKIAATQERTTGSIYKVLQRSRAALHKCIERKLALS
ncbi:MAG: sigma-70 family RNA polymerase sigma factor [Planctomycetota bacterium]